jgi:hypothetical protein
LETKLVDVFKVGFRRPIAPPSNRSLKIALQYPSQLRRAEEGDPAGIEWVKSVLSDALCNHIKWDAVPVDVLKFALAAYCEGSGQIGVEAKRLLEAQREADQKPLPTRQLRTLLTIIAALCRHARIDYGARGASQRIRRATEEIGARVDDGTIASYLKKIPDALESRVK